MKYINGQVWLVTKDLMDFTGLSTGQVNAARARGDLKEFQENGEHSALLFDPNVVVQLQYQIWKEGRIGTSKLRKKPVIKDYRRYTALATKLQRAGVFTNSLELVAHPTQASRWVLQDPTDRRTPDVLPFKFLVGNSASVPIEAGSADAFRTVHGCYGFADETNSECSASCAFFKSCCAARFDILDSIAKAVEERKDPKNMMRRAQVRATRRLATRLAESP